jgi:hypothetical protein
MSAVKKWLWSGCIKDSQRDVVSKRPQTCALRACRPTKLSTKHRDAFIEQTEPLFHNGAHNSDRIPCRPQLFRLEPGARPACFA